MGIFTEKNSRGENVPRVGRIAGAAIGSAFAAATALSSVYINQERQVSLEVLFGGVTNEVKTPGLKLINPLASRYAYSLARESTTVDLNELRLGDDIRLSGSFEIEYQINSDADTRKLYYDLKGQGGDLKSVIDVRANDAAVRAIEALTIADLMPATEEIGEDGNMLEASSFTEKMTHGIHQRMQDALSANGWPVKVIGVYSKGFAFSPESETRIADMVGVRMETFKLALREENARIAQNVFKAEAEADAAYINGLRESGLPDSAVAEALCLKMARDAGRSNEPFAAGCRGNNGGTGVVVDPRTVQKTPQPQPQP